MSAPLSGLSRCVVCGDTIRIEDVDTSAARSPRTGRSQTSPGTSRRWAYLDSGDLAGACDRHLDPDEVLTAFRLTKPFLTLTDHPTVPLCPTVPQRAPGTVSDCDPCPPLKGARSHTETRAGQTEEKGHGHTHHQEDTRA